VRGDQLFRLLRRQFGLQRLDGFSPSLRFCRKPSGRFRNFGWSRAQSFGSPRDRLGRLSERSDHAILPDSVPRIHFAP
jgi:hypothetical protein